MNTPLLEWFELNIKLLKSELGHKLGAIASSLGIHRQTLYSYVTGKLPLPFDVADKLAKAYNLQLPESIEGIGPVNELNQGETAYKTILKDSRYKQSKIKYYNQDAMDARIDFFSDIQEKHVTAHFEIPTFNDCDYAITISGEDMLPSFQQGDVALCRAVKDRTQINFGDAYLLITSELRVIKFIHPAEKAGHVLLKSSNTNFPSWHLELNKISHLYSIKGVLRRKRM